MNIESRANEESREQKQSFFGGALGGALLLSKESVICRPFREKIVTKAVHRPCKAALEGDWAIEVSTS